MIGRGSFTQLGESGFPDCPLDVQSHERPIITVMSGQGARGPCPLCESGGGGSKYSIVFPLFRVQVCCKKYGTSQLSDKIAKFSKHLQEKYYFLLPASLNRRGGGVQLTCP